MKPIKFLIFFAIVLLLTVAGYFSIWSGGVLFEVSGKNNIYLVAGKALLWPSILWGSLRDWLTSGHTTTSYLELFLSQYFGYGIMYAFIHAIKPKHTNKK